MKKTFTIDNIEHTVTEVTAVASCDLDAISNARQNALLVVNCQDDEKIEKVVFGYEMPETAEDFRDMADDSSAWESDYEVLETVEIL